MAYKIRFVNPQKQYADHRDELLNAMDDVLTRGALVSPQDLAKFEEQFAAFVGVKHAIGVNSGTSALDIALQATGIGPGDEVITVAHTFIASISTVCLRGAKAVLVDVGTDMNMDVAKLEAALSPRTKAILPVHLNGRLCDMETIMDFAKKHGLLVIEDAAQALGSTMKMADGAVKSAGSFGAVGAFSLYWAKTLGGLATSGIAVTNDDDLARTLRLMRYNGEDRVDRHFYYHAHNFLMDNVKAAFLAVKMKYLPSWIARRRAIAERYRASLAGIPGIHLPHFDDPRRTDTYNNYVIRVPRRDELKKHFDDHELVETLISWPIPMYREPVMAETKETLWRFGTPGNELPETERVCSEVLSLPMYPELTDAEVDEAAAAVRAFYA